MFYAVKNGHNPGIYSNWEECEKQIKGFSNAKFKKFNTKLEAFDFILQKESSPIKEKLLISSNNSDNSERSSNTNVNELKRISSTESTNENNSTKLSLNKNLNEIRENEQATPIKKIRLDNQSETTKTSSEKKQSVKTNVAEATKKLLVTPSIGLISFDSSKEVALKKLAEYHLNSLRFNFGNKPITVYTDGACSGNGQESASAAIGVYWAANHPLNVSKKLVGLPTNNRAEITAASVAISQAIYYNASSLTIYTDSKFMISCATLWIKKWKSNGWKTNSKAPVKNQNDLVELDTLCSKINVKWVHVFGHSGILGNEEADKLARNAIN